MRAISFSFLILFFACTGSKSDLEKMQETVREYYFLDDTADVNATIIDTLTVELVEEMLNNVDKNLSLVQMDLDTLSTIIENHAYALLASDSTKFNATGSDSTIYLSSKTDYELLKYRFKQSEIEAKKESYIHTKRILNRLKRKSWANVGGFNVEISFFVNGIYQNDEVLMDGEFNIVD